jgi:GMP synthase (glutamine-hydrolysing)
MKKILLIFHQPTTNPGIVVPLLQKRGYELDIRILSQGDELPPTLDNHEGAISFGGSMSANDGQILPYIQTELDWLPKVLSSDTPFLGICLGAQLLAQVLGAKVTRHPLGKLEIGYWPLSPTPAGMMYFDSNLQVYQWHREGFEIPSGAIKLASGEIFANQAFRYGNNAYGVQFHPEMVQEVLDRWKKQSDRQTQEDLKHPEAQSWEKQMQDHLKYAPMVENWLDRFFDIWLK